MLMTRYSSTCWREASGLRLKNSEPASDTATSASAAPARVCDSVKRSKAGVHTVRAGRRRRTASMTTATAPCCPNRGATNTSVARGLAEYHSPDRVGGPGSGPDRGSWEDERCRAGCRVHGSSVVTAELAVLVAALDEVAGGGCRAVLVTGDAGIGKSRLVTELARRAAAVDAEVLVGTCLDLAEGGAPYAAVNEVLAAIGTLTPAGSGAAPSDRLLDALGQLTAARPVVLVLEDVHWSDRSTQDLLTRLAAGPAVPRLLLLATCRSDDSLPRVTRCAGRSPSSTAPSGSSESSSRGSGRPTCCRSWRGSSTDDRTRPPCVPSSSGPTASPCSPRSSPRRSPGTASCPSASTSCCCPGSTGSARRPRTCCEPLPSAAGASDIGCSPRSAPTTRRHSPPRCARR